MSQESLGEAGSIIRTQVLNQAQGGQLYQRVVVLDDCFHRLQRPVVELRRQQAHCGSADNGGRYRVINEGGQAGTAIAGPLACGMDGLRVVGFAGAALREPGGDGIRSPLVAFGLVAAGAGVGRAQGHRQVRPRHAETVVAPRIHHHVRFRGHVTVHAGRTRTVAGMVMVLGTEIDAGLVALGAQRIALDAQLGAVGLVAVAASHAGGMHRALQERAVYVDLIQNLAVRVIEPFVQ